MVIKHGSREDKNGWIYISIRGAPKERGFAYGTLIAKEMIEVRRILDFTIYNDFGVKWEYFIQVAQRDITPVIASQFPEFYEEMLGFAEGANLTIDEVVAWNNYFTLVDSWWNNMSKEEKTNVYGENYANQSVHASEGGNKDRCSAFIAVGDWTADGKIVCAHNTFSDFLTGQLGNYVVDIHPEQGNRILWSGYPGWIWSGTDFFVTSAGILGAETTIGGFKNYQANIPISCRIRNAMQYGKNLDDYERMLLDGNSGDYACTWMFGDTNVNEIMRIELGLRFHNTTRTQNGVFIGYNAPEDPRIRNLECTNTGIDDIRRHQGARKVRLADLMDIHKGTINIDVAQQIISDHYDVYLNKENPCSRTVCSHYELDPREYMSDPSRPKPFEPHGALDGNVIDTQMAKNMSFSLRWGSSCGKPFMKDAFCDKQRVWNYLRPYLHDRLSYPWTTFTISSITPKKLTRKRRTITK